MSVSYITIDLFRQTLSLTRAAESARVYQVSTGKNGAGERMGSGCTPRGQHEVRAKIGTGFPAGSVFVGRRATGEIWSTELAEKHPERDWILTRILWLRGRESGRNRFGDVDTMRRCVYIHGCPDTEPMGIAASRGCIRMRNTDIIELFDLIDPGAAVLIA